jgi:hypothetical protein
MCNPIDAGDFGDDPSIPEPQELYGLYDRMIKTPEGEIILDDGGPLEETAEECMNRIWGKDFPDA